MKLWVLTFSISLFFLGLMGCGSSGSDSPSNGSLSLYLTDAPIDGATEVVVKFDAVELKPQSGPSFTITFNTPQLIDLYALQNGETAPLLQNQTLQAGEYNWMRLMVDADQGEMDSYISFEDGSSHSLYVPSGGNTGLQLNSGFTIAAGATANFTLDFDLRKSIHKPAAENQDYKLRPTIRILDNTEVGSIVGTIAPSTVSGASCEEGIAVYLYSGSDVDPDDEGSPTSPVTSSVPVYDATNDIFNFTLAYLLPGEYTVALTCDADNDDPEVDENETDWSFVSRLNATVSVEQVTTVTFE